jgi:8-oxo-dGTP pyrophosphatase MutT (NUDIX family)
MDQPHFVVATAIVHKDGKYLILRRPAHEEKFPGMWTVPGGNLDTEDYQKLSANAAGIWYNIIEHLVAREVKEETGLDITNVRYLLSLSYMKKKGPSLVLSMYATCSNTHVQLEEGHDEYAWVSVQEAKEYELIPGIHEEILMVDDILHHRPVKQWEGYEELVKELRS